MGIYALQLHAERQHINFMAIEARQKELQQQQQKEKNQQQLNERNNPKPQRADRRVNV